ncbi:hypothetical protein OAE34_01245 [Akkermansiaceae bacterium]|nr:hypothetical protein [Akkermansiaceae bacterium]
MPKVTNVELYCPYCTQRLEADISYRGHQISCQGCGQLIVVPANAKVVTKKFSLSILIGLVAIGVAILVVAITLNADPPKDRSEKPEPTVAYDEASPEQLQRVKAALGEKFTVHEAQTIKSYTHSLAYYVGARFSFFSSDGIKTVVGIWIMTGEKNDPRMTLSVDGFAHQFSGLPLASKTKLAPCSILNQEASELKKALTK